MSASADEILSLRDKIEHLEITLEQSADVSHQFRDKCTQLTIENRRLTKKLDDQRAAELASSPAVTPANLISQPDEIASLKRQLEAKDRVIAERTEEHESFRRAVEPALRHMHILTTTLRKDLDRQFNDPAYKAMLRAFSSKFEGKRAEWTGEVAEAYNDSADQTPLEQRQSQSQRGQDAGKSLLPSQAPPTPPPPPPPSSQEPTTSTLPQVSVTDYALEPVVSQNLHDTTSHQVLTTSTAVESVQSVAKIPQTESEPSYAGAVLSQRAQVNPRGRAGQTPPLLSHSDKMRQEGAQTQKRQEIQKSAGRSQKPNRGSPNPSLGKVQNPWNNRVKNDTPMPAPGLMAFSVPPPLDVDDLFDGPTLQDIRDSASKARGLGGVCAPPATSVQRLPTDEPLPSKVKNDGAQSQGSNTRPSQATRGGDLNPQAASTKPAPTAMRDEKARQKSSPQQDTMIDFVGLRVPKPSNYSFLSRASPLTPENLFTEVTDDEEEKEEKKVSPGLDPLADRVQGHQSPQESKSIKDTTIRSPRRMDWADDEEGSVPDQKQKSMGSSPTTNIPLDSYSRGQPQGGAWKRGQNWDRGRRRGHDRGRTPFTPQGGVFEWKKRMEQAQAEERVAGHSREKEAQSSPRTPMTYNETFRKVDSSSGQRRVTEVQRSKLGGPGEKGMAQQPGDGGVAVAKKAETGDRPSL